MALGIYFVHEGFTPEKYNSAIKQAGSCRCRQAEGAHLSLRSRIRR